MANGDAFSNARKAGGKHHGFYVRYQDAPTTFIRHAIRSLERRIAEHQAKVDDPEKHVEGFAELDPRQQEALLNRVWRDELVNFSEQIAILRGILEGRQ